MRDLGIKTVEPRARPSSPSPTLTSEGEVGCATITRRLLAAVAGNPSTQTFVREPLARSRHTAPPNYKGLGMVLCVPIKEGYKNRCSFPVSLNPVRNQVNAFRGEDLGS